MVSSSAWVVLVASLLDPSVTVAAPYAARALIAPRASAPTVVLDNATITGASSGLVVDKFLGIPFAQPPVGDLRFRLPLPNAPYTESFSAMDFGAKCYQQGSPPSTATGNLSTSLNWLHTQLEAVAISPSDVPAASEDCLTINVWKPASATNSSKLPVIAWIFGGGFEEGVTSGYSGKEIVSRSIDLGSPVVFVSMNYRLSGFGFLASKEVKEVGVGNLGLLDQREAFRWIQKYIGAFGGDPTKVTIQGESAGAISVALHLVGNNANTEGLFRAAFMQSGSPIPVGDITHGQVYYDEIVKYVGCDSASDTLSCLRTVPYDTLADAIDTTPSIDSYQSLNLAWLPRVDGTYITAPPMNLVQQGVVAPVPIITGDCDDEGTIFSTNLLNITTDAQFQTYIQQTYIPSATDDQIAQVLQAYPQDVTQGSPFDTGILNAVTPEFKRLAAFQGDLVFQGPRRWFLQHRSALQPTWSYEYKRNKWLPEVGTAHGSDILDLFGIAGAVGGGDFQDISINFATNLDPNGKTVTPSWPKWSVARPVSLSFLDGLIPRALENDTYRQAAIDLLNSLAVLYPL